jgi:hypothetical protein
MQISGPSPAIDLPEALRKFIEYRESRFDANSSAATFMTSAGFPPDIFGDLTKSSSKGSLWETSANESWERLACALEFAIDPEYTGTAEAYDYLARLRTQHLNVADLVTNGSIQIPLISIQGTLDTVLPLEHNGRSFRHEVVAQNKAQLHRLYEVQNGNHYDEWAEPPYNFHAIEPILPHARDAFELLTVWVESKREPPLGQCIPRKGKIVPDPARIGRPEHCSQLLTF